MNTTKKIPLQCYTNGLTNYKQGLKCLKEGNKSEANEKFSSAKGEFLEAIRLEPNVVQFFYALALTNLKLNETATAIDNLTEAIKILESGPPENKIASSHYYEARAGAKKLIGDFEGAVDDFLKAKSIQRKSEDRKSPIKLEREQILFLK